eukprot:2102104-Ditylum_brightwellii.AAC.1
MPRQKTHKTASSKEHVWHKKFSDVNTKDIPNMLQQFAAKYSPIGHLDVADLLLKLLAARGTLLLADATAILEMNQQSDVIQNEVENGNAIFLAGSLVNEIASAIESTCVSGGIVSISKKSLAVPLQPCHKVHQLV